MVNENNSPKDPGSKKINNHQKNEGFSEDNLPKNYNPSEGKLKTEIEKDKDGTAHTVKRARDVEENKAAPVSTDDKTTRNDGEVVSKSRGTANEKEDIETAENRDFNSDTEKKRYPPSHPDNKKDRGNIDL